jgi:hypothetical protein
MTPHEAFALKMATLTRVMRYRANEPTMDPTVAVSLREFGTMIENALTSSGLTVEGASAPRPVNAPRSSYRAHGCTVTVGAFDPRRIAGR